MSTMIQKIALIEQQPHTTGQPLTKNYLGLVGSVEVECQVRLGSVTITIADLRQLTLGQTLKLNQKTHEPIDILLNDQVIARGELMSCDDCFAIYVTEVAS